MLGTSIPNLTPIISYICFVLSQWGHQYNVLDLLKVLDLNTGILVVEVSHFDDKKSDLLTVKQSKTHFHKF